MTSTNILKLLFLPKLNIWTLFSRLSRAYFHLDRPASVSTSASESVMLFYTVWFLISFLFYAFRFCIFLMVCEKNISHGFWLPLRCIPFLFCKSTQRFSRLCSRFLRFQCLLLVYQSSNEWKQNFGTCQRRVEHYQHYKNSNCVLQAHRIILQNL